MSEAGHDLRGCLAALHGVLQVRGRREDLEEVGKGGPFHHRQLLEYHLAFGKELQDLLGAGARRDLVGAALHPRMLTAQPQVPLHGARVAHEAIGLQVGKDAAQARAGGHLDPGQRPGRSRRPPWLFFSQYW